MLATVGFPTMLKTSALAVSYLRPVVGATASMMKEVTAYMAVQNPIPPTTAQGTSLLGLTDSSAIAVMPSNPRKAKNTTLLPYTTPVMPFLKNG